jgi:FecR protein
MALPDMGGVMLFRYLRQACAGLVLALGLSASFAPVMAAGGASAPSVHPQVAAAPAAKLVPWRVIELKGEARTRVPGTAFQSLGVGDEVPIGNEVVTGRNSELVLERANDHMTLSAATWVRLAPPQPGGLLDRFVQSIGTILYDVEPRQDRSFGVEAPYVAAVVKGTRFIVTAGVRQSSVRVERGKVLVTAADGKGSALVEAGGTAVASPRKAPGLILSSIEAPVQSIPTGILDNTVAGTDVAEGSAPSDSGGLSASGATGAASAGGLSSANGAASTAGGIVSGATGTVGGAASSTGSAVGGVVSGAGKAVGGTVGALGGAVAGTADKVGDVADSVADALGGTVGAVGGAVGAAVGGPVGGVVTGATDTVGDVVAGTGDVVDGTVDTVGGVVGGTTKAVGGLVGGLTGGLGGVLGRR